ncbi:hypothetical protein IQ07DRAFT_388261 [Pyrenochaeta sp. DS3sAY3a]|nr:hypothetical protein IQ07DRAFT_388261 [Pyrenochaeta sp. DS3sAY3a]
MLSKLLVSSQSGLSASTAIYIFTIVVLPLVLAAGFLGRKGHVSTTRRRLKNLRRLGISTSNMTNQYDVPKGASTNRPPRIKALFIHPVKSCAPIELERAQITKTGLMFDRICALAIEDKTRADDKSGGWRFLSQRTRPNMSLIKTELWLPHDGSDRNDPLVQAGGCILLSFSDPDVPSRISKLEAILQTWSISATPEVLITIPLKLTAAQMTEYKVESRTFDILGRNASGLDIANLPSIAEALPKLRKFLNISKQNALTFLICTPSHYTRTDTNLAPLERIGTPSVQGFTDDQPINLNSISSVHAVSELLPSENRPLNAMRFRANIWIDGAAAFDEDTWKRWRIVTKRESQTPRARVAAMLSVVARASRCTMPNVNPLTGTFTASNPLPTKKKGKPQPSATLVEYRTVEDSNSAALGFIGVHCVPEDFNLKEAEQKGKGLFIQVGDEIEVLDRGTHYHGATANDY